MKLLLVLGIRRDGMVDALLLPRLPIAFQSAAKWKTGEMGGRMDLLYLRLGISFLIETDYVFMKRLYWYLFIVSS